MTPLDHALAALRAALIAARQANDLPYADRLRIFKQIDDLQEAAEVFLCEAPDYPDED